MLSCKEKASWLPTGLPSVVPASCSCWDVWVFSGPPDLRPPHLWVHSKVLPVSKKDVEVYDAEIKQNGLIFLLLLLFNIFAMHHFLKCFPVISFCTHGTTIEATQTLAPKTFLTLNFSLYDHIRVCQDLSF